MSGHTPGPWELEQTEYGHVIRMGDAINHPGFHDTHNVLEYNHGCFTPDTDVEQAAQAFANARLIANAPDMLEAIQAAHAILKAGNPPFSPREVNARTVLRDALKAVGVNQ